VGPDTLKHYVIYHRGRESHGVVTLVHDASLAGAVTKYVLADDDQLTVHADGSVEVRVGSQRLFYPHVIAYVEALYKTAGEWQIKDVPAPALSGTGVTDLLICEHPSEVEDAIRRCRANLYQDFPRSRARGFLWYTTAGTVVTFYKKRRDYQIDVVARYLIHRWESRTSRWEGGYVELAALLESYDYVAK